jgi:hypothetical protein
VGRVVEVRGYVVRVHLREDGDGPHVHVFKGGRDYRVRLLPDGAELMTRGGREIAQRSEARIALAIVRKHLANCWEEWFGCHGQNLRN